LRAEVRHTSGDVLDASRIEERWEEVICARYFPRI
jgi:hypothetical protein